MGWDGPSAAGRGSRSGSGNGLTASERHEDGKKGWRAVDRRDRFQTTGRRLPTPLGYPTGPSRPTTCKIYRLCNIQRIRLEQPTYTTLWCAHTRLRPTTLCTPPRDSSADLHASARRPEVTLRSTSAHRMRAVLYPPSLSPSASCLCTMHAMGRLYTSAEAAVNPESPICPLLTW